MLREAAGNLTPLCFSQLRAEAAFGEVAKRCIKMIANDTQFCGSQAAVLKIQIPYDDTPLVKISVSCTERIMKCSYKFSYLRICLNVPC